MTRRGAIKGVLEDLLGTFTSRNSDYEGYWLLGFLVGDLESRNIDLLGDPTAGASPGTTPWTFAGTSARQAFRRLMLQYDVTSTIVRQAELKIIRLPGEATKLVNGAPQDGFNVALTARATIDDGRSFEREHRVFVAPHSDRELRSTRPGLRERPIYS